MNFKRASKSQLIALAFGVCTLSFFVGAFATREGDGHEQKSSSLTSFFGLASSEALSQVRKLNRAEAESRAASGGMATAEAAAKSAQKSIPVKSIKEAWKQSTQRLRYLDGCVKSQACESFGQTQPDDYYLETRLAQAAELRDFKQIAIQWRETFGGSNLPKEALSVATHFLKTGDDYVKEAALEIIEVTEPTSDERDALLKALSESGSGPLYEKALKGALLKYKGDARVDRLLLYQAARGATKVRSAIAMHCLPYLNAENVGLFEIVASKRNQRSMEAAYWRANFAEKERMTEGG